MNYKEEEYPKNLNLILEKANDISSNILKKLNHTECPTIEDLYVEMHKTCGVKPEYSIKRDIKLFNELGYVPNIESGKVKSNNEFKGLYVFGEEIDREIKPVYVGISRTIYRRLRQHGFGKLHNQCSLAYLMTKHDNAIIERANVHDKFQDELTCKKEIVRSFKVALYPVKNDYELYFLEVVLSGVFKTKWNSFRTH
jgi:hypothetical protein